MKHHRAVLFLVLGLSMTLFSGCASIGPPRVERDRIEYNLSLTDSWKRQILLNIVKIRYVEPLFFMDVGEIVAAYSLETGVSVGGSRALYSMGGSVDLGATGKYTDRPTITFRPLTGVDFIRGIMSPIPLRNVLSGIEAGASASFILSLGVRDINGLRNERLTPTGHKPADPGFVRAVRLIAELQETGEIHVAKVEDEPGLFLVLGGKESSESIGKADELRTLLGLAPDKDRFRLGGGPLEGDGGTVQLRTYSLAQMLAMVAGRVEMPEEDITSNRALPGFPVHAGAGPLEGTMVRSSSMKPKDAFASVKYRDTWFWVDDHDLRAKRVFTFIMLAFTMLETGAQESQLQLTIPAQ